MNKLDGFIEFYIMETMRNSGIQSLENDLGYANLMELIRDFVPEMSSVINKVV
jgi:hypothetical protein